MKKTALVVVLAAGFVLFSERQAHAYIDPGAGSLLLQALLGGIAGVWVVARLYWRRVAAKFMRSKSQEPAEGA